MEICGLLEKLTLTGASDILISAGVFPRCRINSELAEFEEFGRCAGDDIDSFRRSLLADAAEESYQQTGGADASMTLAGGMRLRINFFTSINGPCMAIRPLRRGSDVNFENLCLPEILKEVCAAGRGLILVTGSTGSGKTTTLSAMVNYINQNMSKHILMIEDPAEYAHTGIKSMINQREVDGTREGSYQQALKYALRENPDVIVIGEIRDTETMETALYASLTGHLVIATLHTADTVLTVERVIGLFSENMRRQAAQDLGLAVNAIFSQRLLPLANGEGLIPAVEVLLGTPTVKKQISDQDLEALELTLRSGIHQGMQTFNHALLNLYRTGDITYETAIAASSNPEEFKLLIRGVENGTGTLLTQYGSNDENTALSHQISVRTLLRSAVRNNASDMILSVGLPPLVKISGEILKLDLPPLTPEDIERLIFSVLTRRQRVNFEEKKELDFALAVRLVQIVPGEDETICRFRINIFYQRGTMGMVARVVNNSIPAPAALGLPQILLSLINKKQGLLLVTGPTGSGKSTTLASLIEEVNKNRACHIVTIEDPIEYLYENKAAVIEQRELHSDTLSFAGALRAAMREAPDVILVGEMRDTETIAAALTAAETGHLVLATLHTNSAAQTVDRIIDSFPANQQNQVRQQLAATLLGVVSQRLLPRRDAKGMVAAFEVMIGTPPVAALIRDNKNHLLQSTLETSFKDGMQTMQKALEELYHQGKISMEDTTLFTADYHTVKAL